MAPIKVGFVGYGFSTNCFHLPFVLPNEALEVYAFLQRATGPADAKRFGHCTSKFPKARHYRTPEEFFADDDIELVIVCTHEHEMFTEKALKAGKHVVVEKPFATTSANAAKMIALAKQQAKVLTAFHNRRFDSDFRTLEFLVKGGTLGEVTEAQMHFGNWVNGYSKVYSPGDGMLFGLGSHTIDQSIRLFGRPEKVTGFLRATRPTGKDSEVDDSFTAILQYSGEKKNLIVTIKTAIVTNMKDQLKFFVRGTEGTYLKFGSCPQEAKAIAAPGEPASDANFGVEDERIWGTLTTKKEFDPSSQKLDEASGLYIGKYPSLPGWYRGYYENVVDAIRGTGEIHVKPEEALDGLKIMELLRESHEKGCTMTLS